MANMKSLAKDTAIYGLSSIVGRTTLATMASAPMFMLM